MTLEEYKNEMVGRNFPPNADKVLIQKDQEVFETLNVQFEQKVEERVAQRLAALQHQAEQESNQLINSFTSFGPDTSGFKKKGEFWKLQQATFDWVNFDLDYS